MPIASSLSLNDSPSQTQVISEDHDRETFSHQTLILTALAAINNQNHHPTFMATEVENERIQYLKDKNNHTPVIDAATTILITDTEILATMTVQNLNAHRLVAIKEINQEEESRFNSLLESQLDDNTSELFLRGVDEVLHSDHDREKSSPPIRVHPSSTDAICKPIKMDKGLWTQILELRSGYIDEPTKSVLKHMLISLELLTNRISFGTHVATVRDYLNWYRVANNDTERQNASTIFAEYLVSACWRKMERRIGHWASVGLMNQLYTMSDILADQLSHSPIDNPVSRDATQSDFKLSAYLRTLAKTDSLKNILAYHKYRPRSDLSGSNETKNEQVLPCLLLRCRDNPRNLYSTETVVEFHHLLVACLLYYAKSIRDLRIFHTVGMGIKRLIKLIIDYERKLAKKYSGKQFKRDTHRDNANVAFEHFGTMEESEETKEGNLMETKDSEFSAQLKSLIDNEVNQMTSLDEVGTGATEEKKQLKKIAKLKSYLDGKLNKTLDDATPEAAEETKQRKGTEEFKLLTKLKSYFDMKLSTTSSSLPATNSKDKFGAVFFSSRILNALLVSGAFQRHIGLMVTRGLLAFPTDTLQSHYRCFAEDRRIPWRQSRGAGVLQTVREIGNADLDPEDGGVGELETDQEPFTPLRGDVALAIRAWGKLFVQHHHAKTTLETFFRHEGRDIPIEVKVYGVSLPEHPLPLPTWETLKTVMRSSLQDKTAEDQDKMINVFESYFKTSDDTNDDNTAKTVSPRKNGIYNVIGNIITQKANTRYYNMHCEVALAGLVAASKVPSEVARFVDEDLLHELKRLNPTEVAVSKLCCPACWEYFDILSKKHILPDHEEAQMYKIRGRHSTLFPVQLPAWTPTDVVQELIIRFGRYLRTELDTMWSDHLQKQVQRSGHRNTSSFQSVLSAMTEASKNSAESNVDKQVNVSFKLPMPDHESVSNLF